MHIGPDSMDRATLEMFREARCDYPRGRIFFTQAEKRWRATGFRRDDLYAALDRLEDQSCIRFESESDLGVEIVLTAKGHARLALSTLNPFALWKYLWSTVQVARVRWRARTSDAPQHDRRAAPSGGRRLGRAARIAESQRSVASRTKPV